MNPEKPANSFTKCPRCAEIVDDESTHCASCGEFFPAMRHRRGNVVGGALCGMARGLTVVVAIGTTLGIWSLIASFRPGTVILVIAGSVFSLFLFRLSTRLHGSVYRVE